MTSYEEVIGWADTIDEVVKQGRMPPWHANPKYGKFANDCRLSEADKKLIADWVQSGTPKGDMKDLPAAPAFADGWRIPKPDVILTVPKAFKVPPTERSNTSSSRSNRFHRRQMGAEPPK